MRELTERQKLFCKKFLATGCAAESVSKAGYGVKNPSAYGYRLLHKTTVQDYLKERAVKNSRYMVDEMIDLLISMQEQIERPRRIEDVAKIYRAVFKLYAVLINEEVHENEES